MRKRQRTEAPEVVQKPRHQEVPEGNCQTLEKVRGPIRWTDCLTTTGI